MFHITKEDKSQVIAKAKTNAGRTKDLFPLIVLWEGGDLSFAPDLNSVDYLHRSDNNINLNLNLINQTTVSNIKFSSHVLVKPNKCILFPHYFTARYRSVFYVQHVKRNTYKK